MSFTPRRSFLKIIPAVLGSAITTHRAFAEPAATAPTASSPAARHSAASQGETGSCKVLRGLVVLVEFPGTPHAADRAFVIERFEKLKLYVSEMSYGRVCLDVTVTSRWYRTPEPIERYRISPINLNVDQTRVRALIDDVFDMAEPETDLTGQDFIAFVLGAQLNEFGMPGFSAYPGMLGWNPGRPIKTRKGQPVKGVAVYIHRAHLGTLFHDIAHVIGGVNSDGNRVLPCLYDHDLQARGPTRAHWVESMIHMGFWDSMSSHFYKPELPPPGISAWTKLRLGWLPAEKVKVVDPAVPSEVVLGPLEDVNSETLVIRVPLDAKRYLLIENRQPIGIFDRNLPGHGVLIMKADDGIAECRRGQSPIRIMDANPDQKWLLGAAHDLPGQSKYVDKEHGIEVRLLEKTGHAYRIAIGKAPLAP